MYAVNGSVEVFRNGKYRTEYLPTFYLDASVQGILNVKHADQIAREIVDPCKLYDRVTLSVVWIGRA